MIPSAVILKIVLPSIVIATSLPEPVSVSAILVSFLAILVVLRLPLMVPVVVTLPVAASISNAPTVRPFFTTKLLFAIVHSPYLRHCVTGHYAQSLFLNYTAMYCFATRTVADPLAGSACTSTLEPLIVAEYSMNSPFVAV